MAGDEEKPIRIVDRRMFTPDGELRPGFEPDEAPEAPARTSEAAPAALPPPPPRAQEPEPPAEPEETAAGEEPPAEPQEPGSDFASLVRSLATTAYSALGLIPDPSGSRRRDVGIARQMIDWLAVLEQKTRGNISVEESDFLARVLYELRLAYVEITRPPAR
jgi:Domain of unknown function (DUF1844).